MIPATTVVRANYVVLTVALIAFSIVVSLIPASIITAHPTLPGQFEIDGKV